MSEQFVDPSLQPEFDIDLDVEFADALVPGWRTAVVTGQVGGYQFHAEGTASRDERALATALEDFAAQLRTAFPRVYAQ